jgi:hypothetical protein
MKTILQGIGVVFTLLASFLGLMYILKGDVIFSAVVSLVLVVIEFFLIEKFIKSKTEITKNKFSTLSILLWSFYGIIAIPISIFLMHTLTVEIYAMPNVQSVANKKIEDLTKMVSTFNAASDASYNSFAVDLTNKLERYANESNNNVKSVYKDSLLADPYKISVKQLNNIDKSHVELTVKPLIESRKMKLLQEVNPVLQADTIFLQKYSYVFDKWAHFQITYAFYELDNLLKKNKDILIDSYKKHIVFPNAVVFDYNYTQDETNLSNPIELFGIYNPYLLFIVVLFFHFLILLPYFLTDAGGTYPPGGGKSDNSGGIEI